MIHRCRGAERRRGDAGFTLPEVTLAAVILPVVLAAAFLVFQALSQNYDTIQTKAQVSGDTQTLLNTMVREIRQAQEITQGGGAFAAATATQCTFYSDIDHDGIPDRVSYYVSAGAVWRVVGKATLPVYPYDYVDQAPVNELELDGGSPDIFTYYDSSVPPQQITSGAQMSSIAVVGIDLQVSRTSQGGTVSSIGATQVKVRSLFNSLD